MKGTPAIYLGRIVDKENFRAFIYGPNGEKKLVESWDEFEANMQSGVWFATIHDAEASKVTVKEKSKPRTKQKQMPKIEVADSENVLPDDDSVFEVKNGE